MTLENFLQALRRLDLRLGEYEVERFFKENPTYQQRFISFRHEVAFLVGKLTNAQLNHIANKLDELSGDLNAGISDLRGKIDTLNDAVAILNALAAVLGLAARIAVLLA